MQSTFSPGHYDYSPDGTVPNGTASQRRRLQHRPAEDDESSSRPFQAPSFAKPTTSQPAITSPTHVRRRSTLMQNKATSLLGPRPLQGSKRVTSESQVSSSSAYLAPILKPTSTGEVLFGRAAGDAASKFSFTSSASANWPREETANTSEFLPSVNFDDMHSRIASQPQSSEPTTSSFTFNIPATNPNRYVERSSGKTAMEPPDTRLPQKSTNNNQSGSLSRNNSLLRRYNGGREGSAIPVAESSFAQSMSRSTLNANTFEPPSDQPAASAVQQTPKAPGRIPRKSILPVTTGKDAVTPAVGTSGGLSRSSSLVRHGQQRIAARNIPTVEAPQTDANVRSARARSMQPPPPKLTLPRLEAPPATGSGTYLSSPVFGLPPGSPVDPNGLPPTPTSGRGDRQSSIHMGGLGARTISPTDARRMKRMSMANPVPSLPPSSSSSHFTLQTEARAARRAAAASPAVVTRKSLTPSSSARTTPDPARKLMAVQLSVPALPNTPALSPLRTTGSTTSNTTATRNVSNQPASRLPQPAKARNVHSSAGMAPEEVPPVPAIPKAYESPKDQEPLRASSYFSTGKPVNGDAPTAMTTFDYSSSVSIDHESSSRGDTPVSSSTQHSTTTRQRRGMTESASIISPRNITAQNGPKRTLQPLMLPPLNLLPLEGSTSSHRELPPLTPTNDALKPEETPPRRQTTKTPSTPMTASKTTFFTRSYSDYEEIYAPIDVRANTSQNIFRPLPLPVAKPVPSPRVSLAPQYDSAAIHRASMTPMMSTATAHSRDVLDYQRPPLAHHQSHDVVLDSTSAWADKSVETPSSATFPSSGKELPANRSSAAVDPSTPGSGSSLRRKLSLSWKRSSSKASQRIKAEIFPSGKEAAELRASKTKEMPPPKMPASANWKNNLSQSTADYSGASRPSLDTKYRQSQSSITSTIKATDTGSSRNPSRIEGTKTEAPTQSTHQRTSSRSSSSLLNPVRNMLGSRSSTQISTLKARHLDINLDKNDLAADKIMEKLSAKRKDFEQAAKDVDELRRRASAKERVTSLQAIQTHALNIFERGEIIDYKEVYFCGTRSARKHVGNLDSQANNFGYDDERGDYNIVLGDHLAYRYEVIDLLGKGSFGQVVRCIDHKTGLLVAIKIIRNKKRFHQQALVEVDILQRLREWDPNNDHSMINFTQSFYFRSHLCISTELLSMNLYEFIKAHEFKGFPLPLIRRFTKQMLSSLVLLKSKRVIHCDLKPENVLLVHPIHSEIKTIDFGSSCFENEKVYTYIQSRFYRSPEVILGMSYGLPIDMWSLGCILAELFTGYPIFPGENEQEQLACIMEIFGPPEKHIVEKSSRRKLFFDSMGKPRVTVSSKGRRRRPSSRTLQQALKCDDEAFLDFITRCLRWDPDRRLKPEEALHHEYITGIKRTAVTTRSRTAPAIQQAGAASSPVKRVNITSTPLKVTPRDASGSRLPLDLSSSTSAPNGNHRTAANGVGTTHASSNNNLSLNGSTGTGISNHLTAANLAVKQAAAAVSTTAAAATSNRRHSTMAPLQSSYSGTTSSSAFSSGNVLQGSGIKRVSGMAAVGGTNVASSAPRATVGGAVGSGASHIGGYPMQQQRSASGRLDMASAAAIASINGHRGK